MSETIKIDIWSDIACPWCYLGKHRFEKALREFASQPDARPVEVEYHSYQLSPELAEDYAGSHADYMAERLGWSAEQVEVTSRNMRALGQQYGLDYDFSINRKANTHKAHQLLHYAKAHDRQQEVKELLFKAHFSDGVHVGEIEALGDIAQKAGLDRDDAVRALQAGEYAEAVEADKARAASHGITGVPFFVVAGKYGLSGAQEPPAFLKALVKAAEEGNAP